MLLSLLLYVTWIKPKARFCTARVSEFPRYLKIIVFCTLGTHAGEYAEPVRVITSVVIMAEINLTSLARALSQPQLNLVDGTNDVSSPRNIPLQPSRWRKLSSCNSIESIEPLTSPSTTEARVLVINTGGTIGMTLHDNGNCRSIRLYFSCIFTVAMASQPASMVDICSVCPTCFSHIWTWGVGTNVT